MIRCPKDPTEFLKRETFEVSGIGGDNPPVVFADFSKIEVKNYPDLKPIGYNYSPKLDKWNTSDLASDIIYLGKNKLPFDQPNNIKSVYDYEAWREVASDARTYPLYSFRTIHLLLKKDQRN
ncbi:MAG: hypothetical protein U5K00_01810 [Melioribacteraceae bacterium]|nr:hypothetical protein [Melioribacteraceae bacterium]